MNECQELKKIQVEEEKHIDNIKYVRDISESELEHMSYIESEKLMTEESKQEGEEIQKKFQRHLKSCQHPQCKQIAKVWEERGLFK